MTGPTSKEEHMWIAAVQFDTRWEDRKGSHARARELIAGAAVPRGALVVLPEMFDVGFSMNTAITDPGAPSASDAFLRDVAREKGAAVLAGVVARTTDGRLANEAVAFGPDGRELVRYRKRQPFTPPGEHIHYPAGSVGCAFEWDGVKIAPFVCYDLRFPELFRPAAKGGAELMVVVSNWPDRRSEHWVRLLQARAIENQSYVLGVNRCGADPSFRYDGRSALFDPHGNAIFEMDGREQVGLGEVDGAIVRKWREDFPALRDMR
jgi:predicted amidohydrolase